MIEKKENYLYVFFHMPKCAGLTMRFHIEKNLSEDRRLIVSFDFLKLDPADLPNNPVLYKEAALKRLCELSKYRRERLKVIYGHFVPYGIDEIFDRPVRYFTFLRDPVERIISAYKYSVNLYRINSPDIHKWKNIESSLLINGKVPKFSEWLINKYNPVDKKGTLSMINTFKRFGYLRNSSEISENDILNCLNKFYFVGTRKNYNEESLFIYSKLGFHKFYFDQNISKEDIRINLSKNQVKEYLIQNDKLTFKLFELVKKRSESFKKESPDYYNIVKTKSIERNILLPITQSLYSPRNTLLRLYGKIIKRDNLSSDIRKN